MKQVHHLVECGKLSHKDLNNNEFLEKYFSILNINNKQIKSIYHFFEPFGITGFVYTEDGHYQMVVHTWPEFGRMCLDYYLTDSECLNKKNDSKIDSINTQDANSSITIDRTVQNIIIKKKDDDILGYHTIFTLECIEGLVEKVETELIKNNFNIIQKIEIKDTVLWFLSESHCRLYFDNNKVYIDLFCCGKKAQDACKNVATVLTKNSHYSLFPRGNDFIND
jgi:S-adenosylmethionine/arginine decarboxylase-like enzyme